MTDRPSFRQWIDSQTDPGWPSLPLTHITGGVETEDIIFSGSIIPQDCPIMNQPLCYLFYGRPAYRIADVEVVKLEESCPYCFVFSPDAIQEATSVHAFDTGAFEKRIYSHVISAKMGVDDFSLGSDLTRLNKLVSAVFKDVRDYILGDISKAATPESASKPWQYHVRAYLELLHSRTRNEPDDRVCSIEVAFSRPLSLETHLKAIVVPHTIWSDGSRAPWLAQLEASGILIRPYNFIPGRHPEHYHALVEASVIELYEDWGILCGDD